MSPALNVTHQPHNSIIMTIENSGLNCSSSLKLCFLTLELCGASLLKAVMCKSEGSIAHKLKSRSETTDCTDYLNRYSIVHVLSHNEISIQSSLFDDIL
jgi:hypothetical protein